MSNITLPKVTDLEQAIIETARAEGQTVDQISRLTGLPYTAVYFYAVNGGVPVPAMSFREASLKGAEARRLKRLNGKNGA